MRGNTALIRRAMNLQASSISNNHDSRMSIISRPLSRIRRSVPVTALPRFPNLVQWSAVASTRLSRPLRQLRVRRSGNLTQSRREWEQSRTR